MATLTNLKIKDTYAGLIKTADNAGIGATFKQLTDGLGTNIPIEVSETDLRILSNSIQITDTAQVNGLAVTGVNTAFGGAVDFSAATVTGLPGGAGLVAGTNTNSMRSADALTATPAVASGQGSIALGQAASATSFQAIAIGQGAESKSGIALGLNADAAGNYASTSIAIGGDAEANSYRGIAIGNGTGCNAQNGVALGQSANAARSGDVAIGYFAKTINSGSGGTISLGVDALVPNAVNAKALALQTDSTPTAGGIIMSDAGGTDRRINIDATGALQIDSTPVGGGGGAVVQNATRTTLAGPSTTDEIITSITIPAGTYTAGDIVEVWAMYTMDYTGGGTNYIAAQISNSASFNDGTYYSLGAASSGVDAGWILNKHLVINTADGTGLGTDSGAVDSMQDIDATTGSFLYGDNLGKPMDWTSTVYIHFTGFVDNVNSSTTLNAGYAKKVN